MKNFFFKKIRYHLEDQEVCVTLVHACQLVSETTASDGSVGNVSFFFLEHSFWVQIDIDHVCARIQTNTNRLVKI